MQIVEKILSINDIGLNGAHQAGILVPKKKEMLDFFPFLDPTEANPRIQISILDEQDRDWTFSYIYYNNKFRGGTRNEYRITGMTSFMKTNSLLPGDVLVFEKRRGYYKVSIRKIGRENSVVNESVITIKLSDSWKIISV